MPSADARTRSRVPSSDPPSAFTITARMLGKLRRSPSAAAWVTYPIVAAFRKLGMPTTMSARSWARRASRMSAGRAEVSPTVGLTTIRRLDRGRRPIRPALHRLVIRSFRVRRRRHRDGHRERGDPHPVRAHPSLRGLERIEGCHRASDWRTVDLLGRGARRGDREYGLLARQLRGLDYIVAGLILLGVGFFIWRHVRKP